MPKIDHAKRQRDAANNDSNLFNGLMNVPHPATEEALRAAVAGEIKSTSLALTRVPLLTWRRVVRAYIGAWGNGGQLNVRPYSAELGINKATLYSMVRVLDRLSPTEKRVLEEIIEEVDARAQV